MGRGAAVPDLMERLRREPYLTIWEVASSLYWHHQSRTAPRDLQEVAVDATSPTGEWFTPKEVMNHVQRKGEQFQQEQVVKGMRTLLGDGILEKGEHSWWRLSPHFWNPLLWSHARAALQKVPFAGAATYPAPDVERPRAIAHLAPSPELAATEIWTQMAQDEALRALIQKAQKAITDYLGDTYGSNTMPPLDVVLRISEPGLNWSILLAGPDEDMQRRLQEARRRLPPKKADD